jgi:tetratricopeptide (TPR) repeat protein
MKFVHTRAKAYVATLFLWCLVLPTILAANNPNEFDPGRLPHLVTQGNYQSALTEANHAIAHYRDLVGACPKEDGGSLMLYNAQVGYYMCAKAQLLALRGDFVSADRILSEAKTYASNHPGFDTFLIDWESVVSPTHAFILEKAGKRYEATKAYESTPSEDAKGRLALLALEAGDDTKASQLALAAGINPTAYFVLGRIQERDHHEQAAREWYNKASVALQTVKDQFLPIVFCEGPAIASAQKRQGIGRK